MSGTKELRTKSWWCRMSPCSAPISLSCGNMLDDDECQDAKAIYQLHPASAISGLKAGGVVSGWGGKSATLVRSPVSRQVAQLRAWRVLDYCARECHRPRLGCLLGQFWVNKAESSCQPPRALQIQAVATVGGDTGLLKLPSGWSNNKWTCRQPWSL